MHLLQRWFNYPPFPNAPFLIDKYGEKFWYSWKDETVVKRLDVFHRSRYVAKTYLDLSTPRKGRIADIIIFHFSKRNFDFRHRGLGKAMMRELISKARECGVKILYGRISPDDYTTTEYLIEWYRRQGFQVFEEKGTYYIEKDLE